MITFSKIKKMSPQLLVADIDRSIEFYTKKLGFDMDFRYEDFYAGIIKDGFSIHLKTGKPSIDERHNKKVNEHLDIIFSVEDIQKEYERLQKLGVKFSRPPTKMGPVTLVVLDDTCGNNIQLVQV